MDSRPARYISGQAMEIGRRCRSISYPAKDILSAFIRVNLCPSAVKAVLNDGSALAHPRGYAYSLASLTA
jgi:hypothetical protein